MTIIITQCLGSALKVSLTSHKQILDFKKLWLEKGNSCHHYRGGIMSNEYYKTF